MRGEDMLQGGLGGGGARLMEVQCRSGYAPERSERGGTGRP